MHAGKHAVDVRAWTAGIDQHELPGLIGLRDDRIDGGLQECGSRAKYRHHDAYERTLVRRELSERFALTQQVRVGRTMSLKPTFVRAVIRVARRFGPRALDHASGSWRVHPSEASV